MEGDVEPTHAQGTSDSNAWGDANVAFARRVAEPAGGSMRLEVALTAHEYTENVTDVQVNPQVAFICFLRN